MILNPVGMKAYFHPDLFVYEQFRLNRGAFMHCRLNAWLRFPVKCQDSVPNPNEAPGFIETEAKDFRYLYPVHIWESYFQGTWQVVRITKNAIRQIMKAR